MISHETRKKTIGQRIYSERKARKMSREKLLEAMYMSPESTKTLQSWERGERLPDLISLSIMAELFDCDISYLLGDIDERKHIIKDGSEMTGLSASAVAFLISLNADRVDVGDNRVLQHENPVHSEMISSLDGLLMSEAFREMLLLLARLRTAEGKVQIANRLSHEPAAPIGQRDLIRYRLQRLLDHIMDDISEGRDYHSQQRRDDPLIKLTREE